MTGKRGTALPPEADAVLAATDRVALGVALVGAAVGRGGTPWPRALKELIEGGETFRDHPYASTFKAINVALERSPHPPPSTTQRSPFTLRTRSCRL